MNAARVFARAALLVLGGPGSGNFGHSGRPGQVGGSSSDEGVLTDEDGQPLVLYHGSVDPDLDVPTPKFGVENAGVSFFTDNEDVAWQYTFEREYGEIVGESSDNVIKANIKMSNPLVVDMGGAVGNALVLGKHIKEAKAKGHDGVIFKNVDDTVDSSKQMGTSYAVFDKAQIIPVKSRALGGPGSGNFGHAGRPGEVGGSAEGDGPSSAAHLAQQRAHGIAAVQKLLDGIAGPAKSWENLSEDERISAKIVWRGQFDHTGDVWEDLTEAEKYNFAAENLSLDAAELPTTWYTGMGDSADDHFLAERNQRNTRLIANRLAVLRTHEILAERGIDFPEVETFQSNIWDNWKNSSSNDDSLAFQIAATKELGGVHRVSALDAERVIGDTHPDEFAAMQAYARAQWETTQFVLDKAGVKEVEVYRGLMLPRTLVNGTEHEWLSNNRYGNQGEPLTVQVKDGPFGFQANLVDSKNQNYVGVIMREDLQNRPDYMNLTSQDMYRKVANLDESSRLSLATEILRGRNNGETIPTKLPDINLQRAGLQSTTSLASVANSWQGVGDVPSDSTRVVLRVHAPATSVISLPVFGQNVHEEQEVVLVGAKDRWEWDAWVGKAPEFEKIPLSKKAPKTLRAATKKLTINLQDEDAGKPHWLSTYQLRRRAVAELMALGGPGSGNFGHAGRPGQVGGSSDEDAAEPAFVYHGTSVSSAEQIKETGIRVVMNYDQQSRTPSSYVTTSEKRAMYYANWKGTEKNSAGYYSGDVAIVEIEIPDAEWQQAIEDEASDSPTDYRLERDIPPEWISGITVIGDKGGMKGRQVKKDGKWIRTLATSHRVYLVVKLDEQRNLGGPGSGNFGHAGRPGEVGGSASDSNPASLPIAGDTVDGRKVMAHVPNESSIDATFVHYEVLDGIREVPLSAFDPAYKVKPYSVSESARVDNLINDINESNEIAPLIVVYDNEKYPYILEGGHRFDALHKMGAKSLPAKVVIDTSLRTAGGPGSGNFGHSGRPGQVGGSSSDGAASRDANGLNPNTGQRIENSRWRENDKGESPYEGQRQQGGENYAVPEITHKVVRENGLWGASHGNSQAITGSAATIMGIEGYRPNEDEIGINNAKKFIDAIAADATGSEEILHHSFENVRHTQFKVGDTMRLPLMAASGRLSDYGVRSDADSQRGEPVVFEFEKGTQMVAYSTYSLRDAKDLGYKNVKEAIKDQGYVWDEAIVAGGYEVIGVKEVYFGSQHFNEFYAKPENQDKTIQIYGKAVRLKQIETFDPNKGWIKRG